MKSRGLEHGRDDLVSRQAALEAEQGKLERAPGRVLGLGASGVAVLGRRDGTRG